MSNRKEPQTFSEKASETFGSIVCRTVSDGNGGTLHEFSLVRTIVSGAVVLIGAIVLGAGGFVWGQSCKVPIIENDVVKIKADLAEVHSRLEAKMGEVSEQQREILQMLREAKDEQRRARPVR